MPSLPRRLLAAAGTLAALAAAPAGAQAATAAQAIAALNAQRAANGLPADVTENPAWSEGCRLHNAYQALGNSGLDGNPHSEDPTQPGFSEPGDEAAHSAVLGASFADDGSNGWENAPVHLMQTLAPALEQTGYDDGCLWTWPGYTRPAPAEPVLYSYPGKGTHIYRRMTAREWPSVPGDFVGLPEGTETGPHLYVLAHAGPYSRARVLAGALTGPDGPVEVRVVDNYTRSALGDLGSYLPPGGILIPVSPLRAGGVYTAQATVQIDDRVLTRRWTFTAEATADDRTEDDDQGTRGPARRRLA